MKMRVELEDGDSKHICESECEARTAYDTAGWLMAGILSQVKLTKQQRIDLLPWKDEVIYFGSDSQLS